MTRIAWLALALGCGSTGSGSGCSADGGDGELDPNDAMLDPETCKECHPQHYQEWLGSMHAYAAEDPVFRAMNARGQRETDGALGDFCVKCHAPMAVQLGLTTDGLDLDDVPQHLQGVTCFFCHTVAAVDGTHNNPLVLSGEKTMLGAIEDPVENDVHASEYSPHLDQRTLESADLCGSCHDIVTDAGVHMERTYAEWQESFMADEDELSGGPAIYGQRCGTCHMAASTPDEVAYPWAMGPVADFPGVRADRSRHPHRMAGVDVALTDFPDADQAQALREDQAVATEVLRQSALCATICVNPDGEGGSSVDVWLHNEHSAHSWPSGAAQDRRAWLELRAFAGDTEVLATGVVPDDQPVSAQTDPLLWQFRDFIVDDAGQEVHMFWEARDVVSDLLPASSLIGSSGDITTWRARRFPVADAVVDRVTTRVRLRPMGLEVLDDLVASGDLDPAIRDAMPVFDVTPTILEWTPDTAETFDGYGPCVSSSAVCGAPSIGAPPPE